MRAWVLRVAALAGTIFSTFAALAQPAPDYPNKVVRLLVGYAPGGSTDIVARLVAEELGKRWGARVIVENRLGADSVIATDAVAKSPPDGYTLLLANSANATHPTTQKKLPFDPVRDLTPIIVLASTKNVLTTASPAINTLQDALALAAAKPGTLTYGSGSPLHHLIGELMAQKAGVKLVHVPYRGAGPAVTDTVAGHIVLNVGTVASQEPFIRSGSLKALAVAAQERSSVLPSVPTFSEGGLSDVHADYWIGLIGPVGMPAELVEKINRDSNAVLKDPGLAKRLVDIGLDVVGGSPGVLRETLLTEIGRWERVAKEAGLEMQ